MTDGNIKLDWVYTVLLLYLHKKKCGVAQACDGCLPVVAPDNDEDDR